MATSETCHHAWGDWTPTSEPHVYVRHCVICAARQRKEGEKPVTTQYPMPTEDYR